MEDLQPITLQALRSPSPAGPADSHSLPFQTQQHAQHAQHAQHGTVPSTAVRQDMAASQVEQDTLLRLHSVFSQQHSVKLRHLAFMLLSRLGGLPPTLYRPLEEPEVVGPQGSRTYSPSGWQRRTASLAVDPVSCLVADTKSPEDNFSLYSSSTNTFQTVFVFLPPALHMLQPRGDPHKHALQRATRTQHHNAVWRELVQFDSDHINTWYTAKTGPYTGSYSGLYIPHPGKRHAFYQ